MVGDDVDGDQDLRESNELLGRYVLSTLSALMLVSCGGSSDSSTVLQLDPTPHPLVDNLFIAQSGRGGTAPMGGAVGQFAIEGRCLIVDTDGTPRTPTFAGSVTVRKGGLAIAGRYVPYGSPQLLPMIGPPLPIKSMANDACPKESLFIRSLGD